MRPSYRLLFLSVLLGCSVIACRRASVRVIEVIPKGTTNVFWQSVHAGAQKAGEDFHYEVVWNGPPLETEYARQANIVEDAVNRGVSGIVLAPAHSSALVPAVRRALAAHIPVTIFDSGINLAPADYVSYVATNNELGGRMAADRAGEVLKGRGQVAIVGVAPGSVSTSQREQGFRDEITAKFPSIHVVELRYGMADVARSRAVAEDILTAHPDLDGIFASNESSSVGALQALKSRGLATKVKLIGFDAGPILVDALRAGTIDSLVVQDPFQIGYQGVKTMAEKLNGQTPPAHVDTPIHLVTQANLYDPAIQKVILPPTVQ
jgi:ribose transport system substrate-binding protein